MSRWQEGLVQGLVFGSLGTSFGFGFAAWMADRPFEASLMTWQGKRRKQLPSNWGAIRKARLELDGYRCTQLMKLTDAYLRCSARATEVDHHLDPHDHRLSSLRSLCHQHHAEKTQREAKAAQAAKSRKRSTAKHPGLR